MRYVFRCERGHTSELTLNPNEDNLTHQVCRHVRQDAGRGPAHCLKMAKRVFTPIASKVSFRAGFHSGADRHFSNKREFSTWLDKNEKVVLD